MRVVMHLHSAVCDCMDGQVDMILTRIMIVKMMVKTVKQRSTLRKASKGKSRRSCNMEDVWVDMIIQLFLKLDNPLDME